jgi:ABC-type uncharacterized transport system substrate-binding protein
MSIKISFPKKFCLLTNMDKVKTPVMFNGVNEEPEKYGYPASNVSGILERNFIGETIAFAKQLVPSIKTIGFLAKDSPSGRAILKMLEECEKTCDVLFVDATKGILDSEGKPLDNKQATQVIAKSFKKPIIGANDFHVRNGILCAVVKSGNAQGRHSAQMLLKAIKGTPITDIPITVNKYGKRILNATVMKALGIRPSRRVLVGTDLVRTSGNNDDA